MAGYAGAWLEYREVTSENADGEFVYSASYVDAAGNVVASLDMKDTSGDASDDDWSFVLYDAENRAVASVSADGSWSTTGYNELGRVTGTARYEAGHPPGEVYITSTAYDALGRVISSTSGGTTTTAYVTSGTGIRYTIVEDLGAGYITISGVDIAGRACVERSGYRDGEASAEGELPELLSDTISEITYGYDEHGRRGWTRGPRGLETHVSYDDAGRETRSVAQLPDGRKYVTRKGYDIYGRPAWSQSPMQDAGQNGDLTASVYTTYDYILDDVDSKSYGQVKAVYYNDTNTDGSDNGATPDMVYERYVYDAEGRRTDVIRPVQLSEGAGVVEVAERTVFDGEGRQDQVFMDHGGADEIMFDFGYDARGAREFVIYPSGLKKEWARSYDADDTLTQLVESQVGPAGGGGPPAWKTTNYDPESYRTTSIENNSGSSIGFVYDMDGVVEWKKFVDESAQVVSSFQYTYDGDGGRDKVLSYAGDGESGGTQDARRRRATGGNDRIQNDRHGSLIVTSYKGHAVHYDYDEFGRMEWAAEGDRRWDYVYTDGGRIASVTCATDGVREEREHDALGRLEKLTHVDLASDEVIFESDYILGVDGNRLGIVETRGSSVVRWNYEYDRLGRLIREKRDAGNDGTIERDIRPPRKNPFSSENFLIPRICGGDFLVF